MEVAFRHNAWATRAQLDLCRDLTPVQLEVSPPGVYGGILDTLRHLVGADRWYVHGLMGQPGDLWAHRPEALVEEAYPLDDVMLAADQNDEDWRRLLPTLDANTQVVTQRLEGGVRTARVASGSRKRCITAAITGARWTRFSPSSVCPSHPRACGTTAS